MTTALLALCLMQVRFVNGWSDTFSPPGNPHLVQVPFSVGAGDTLIVAIGAGSGGNSVTDDRGDTFRTAVALEGAEPTLEPYSATLFFATGVAGGTTTLSIDNQTALLRVAVLEYAGLEGLDSVVTAHGYGRFASTGDFDAGTPGGLIVAWAMCRASIADGGAGWTNRAFGVSSRLDDRVGIVAGTHRYDAECTSTDPWAIEAAVFSAVADGGTQNDGLQFRQVGCGCSETGAQLLLVLPVLARVLRRRGSPFVRRTGA